MNNEDRIQKEIRRRAFHRRDFLAQQTANAQYTQHTIDALQQVTGLPRRELETIAGEVTASFSADNDDFFSIKAQLIYAGSVFIPALTIIWLVIHWI